MNRKTVLVTLGTSVAAVWLGAGITYAAKFADRPTLGAPAPTTVATVPLIPVPAATTTTTAPAPVTTTTATTAAPAPTTVASTAPVKVAATVITAAPTTTAPETTTTTETPTTTVVVSTAEPAECGHKPELDTQTQPMPGTVLITKNNTATVWKFTVFHFDGDLYATPPSGQVQPNGATLYEIHYTIGFIAKVEITTIDGRPCGSDMFGGGVN